MRHKRFPIDSTLDPLYFFVGRSLGLYVPQTKVSSFGKRLLAEIGRRTEIVRPNLPGLVWAQWKRTRAWLGSGGSIILQCSRMEAVSSCASRWLKGEFHRCFEQLCVNKSWKCNTTSLQVRKQPTLELLTVVANRTRRTEHKLIGSYYMNWLWIKRHHMYSPMPEKSYMLKKYIFLYLIKHCKVCIFAIILSLSKFFFVTYTVIEAQHAVKWAPETSL